MTLFTEPGSYGLDTAVEALHGSGPLTVVICAEYDALPGIGHACGHNVIAASSVGAALALAPVGFGWRPVIVRALAPAPPPESR